MNYIGVYRPFKGSIMQFSRFLSLMLILSSMWTVQADSPIEPKVRDFPKLNGFVAAYGDFNSDKFTDLFLITDNGMCFEVQKQTPDQTENDAQIFSGDSKLRACFNNKNRIVGLIPSDFDGDALMDVVLISKGPDDDSVFELRFLKGRKNEISTDLNVPPFARLLSQPLLLDYNGDMISDLLGYSAEDKMYYVWKGAVNHTLTNPIQFGVGHKDLLQSPKNPNSNSFIDLNGDGLADIFIEDVKMSYWYADKDGYKKPSKTIERPKGYEFVGLSTFCDINDDEKIDHLIPVCRTKENSPCSVLIYDDQREDWVELVNEVKVGDVEYYFSDFKVYGKLLSVPGRLRHGYLGDNGYTDLMALMRRKGGADDDAQVVIFNNRKSSGYLNTTFEITVLNEMKNIRLLSASFFDLYEDGVFDIFVSYETINSSGTTLALQSLSLKEFAGVNFVKILVTSGLCTDGSCFEKRVTGETYRVPYGTNSPGSMVCYQMVNSNNREMKSCGGQMIQSADFALQMPYTIFGLGLYANYIEKLSATVPSGSTLTLLSKTVEKIVPDSQIVFIPNPLSDPTGWKVQLFLTPSDIIYKTLYTLSGICIVLVFLIGILHRKEMLEDVKEQAEFKKQWPEIRR